jgi:photosystem II stability/assembly factor-like uncharacterized protein
MSQRLFYILILVLFVACKKDQGNLTPIAVLDTGTSCRINDLELLSSGRWVACSGVRNEKGFISVSDDAGVSWTSSKLDHASSTYTIDFLDSLNGYAGGDFLHLWKTTDGGLSWEYQWLGNQVPMNEEDRPVVRDFHMLKDSVWFFCGGENLGEGVVYETSDRGHSWQFVFNQHEYRAMCTNDDDLVVGGHGSILRSNEGLNNLEPAHFENDFIMDVIMSDDGAWIAASYQGAVYRSQDGLNWSNVMKGERRLSQVVNWTCLVKSGQRIIVAGTDGAVAESNDHGINWTRYKVNDAPDFWSLLIDGNQVFAGSEEGKIFRIF